MIPVSYLNVFLKPAALLLSTSVAPIPTSKAELGIAHFRVLFAIQHYQFINSLSKKIWKNYFVVFISCFLFSMASIAQSKTVVRAAIDKQEFLIGEQFVLTLEATIPDNELIRFFGIDTIPHFEIIKKEKIDTVESSGSTFLSQSYLLTSFDSGHHTIGPFYLSDGMATDSLPVDIVFAAFDAQQPYHDIKDSMQEVKPINASKDNKMLWPVVIISVVCIIAIAYLLASGEKKKLTQEVSVNAYGKAIQQLKKLSKENTDSKKYYSELTDIFKQYLFDKKKISSLQLTTGEWLKELEQSGFRVKETAELNRFLQMAGLVKFAKAIPNDNQKQSALSIIIKMIEEIEKHH